MPEKTAEHFIAPDSMAAARMTGSPFQRQSTNLSTSFVDNAAAGFLLKSRHSLRDCKKPTRNAPEPLLVRNHSGCWMADLAPSARLDHRSRADHRARNYAAARQDRAADLARASDRGLPPPGRFAGGPDPARQGLAARNRPRRCAAQPSQPAPRHEGSGRRGRAKHGARARALPDDP